MTETKLTPLTTDTFNKVLDGNQTFLVDCYTTWCNPCKLMVPILNKLVDEFPTIAFYKADMEAEPDLAALFEVRTFPTLILYRNKEIIGRYTQSVLIDDIRTWIQYSGVPA